MGDESQIEIKETGNMFIFLKRMHVGGLRFLQDDDVHKYWHPWAEIVTDFGFNMLLVNIYLL